MGWKLEFRSEEVKYCASLADHRMSLKTTPNHKKVDKTQSDFCTQYVGLMGELTVSRFLGVPVDERALIGGDGGVDFVVNQRKLQVKTNTTTAGTKYLYFSDRASFDPAKVDIGILCVPRSMTCVEMVGWMYARRFWNVDCQTVSFGHGPVYAMHPKHLLSPFDLLAAVGKGGADVPEEAICGSSVG